MSDINTPTGWDKDLKLRLEWLTDEQKDRLLEMLKKDKKTREMKKEPTQKLKESLLWKPHWEVMDYLNKKYVKIKENQEMYGYKWRIIEINLPAVLDKHEWFKMKWFISYDSFSRQEYEANPKFENISYSEEEANNIIKWIDKYYEVISPWMEHPNYLINSLVGEGFRTYFPVHHYGGNLNFRLRNNWEKNTRTRRNTNYWVMDHVSTQERTWHLLFNVPE